MTEMVYPAELQLEILKCMMQDRSVDSYRAGILVSKKFSENLVRTFSRTLRIQGHVEEATVQGGHLWVRLVAPFMKASLQLWGTELIIFNISVSSEIRCLHPLISDIEDAVQYVNSTRLIEILTFEVDTADDWDAVLIDSLRKMDYKASWNASCSSWVHLSKTVVKKVCN